MDQRDPSPHFAQPERRRCVRQKLHTPVYASFNGPQTGMVVDLSELLDLHENGFAVQTAVQGKERDNGRFELNRAVSLCLDLPETRNFVHGSGEVVWTDDHGRVGIRFSFLPDPSRHILKEWLFVNLLVASANHVARTEQRAHHQQDSSFKWDFGGEDEPPDDESFEARGTSPASEASLPANLASPEPKELAAAEPAPPAEPLPAAKADKSVLSLVARLASADRTLDLSSIEDLRNRVRDLGDDHDAVLQLITAHAKTQTGAAGAAMAFLTDGAMICRACDGEPAPPVGSTVDVKAGLSGECVRSGLPVQCEDTSTDPRVDPELCRMLGIGSLLAVPIFADFRVVGLLEVFSPNLRNFTQAHVPVLDRLVELVPKTPSRKIESKAEEIASEDIKAQEEEFEQETTHQDSVEQATIEETIKETVIPVGSFSELEIEEEALESATNPRSGEAQLAASPGASLEQADALDHESPLPLPSVRDALWEDSAEAESTIQPEPSVRTAENGEQQDSPAEEVAESVSVRGLWSSYRYVGISILFAALVAGYLLAPVIEKRLSTPAQASPPALETPTVAQAAWKGSASRKPEPRSPLDLLKLADQGDPDAQYGLGVLYHNGEGVPRDDSRAVEWYLRAADQGYVPAQSALGAYYEAGRGVPQDFAKSYFWSVLAVAQGDENSKFRLQDLGARMTRSQIANARQQAEVWLHSHSAPAPKSN